MGGGGWDNEQLVLEWGLKAGRFGAQERGWAGVMLSICPWLHSVPSFLLVRRTVTCPCIPSIWV